MPDSPARTCPKCATAIPASFPEGLCPKCLLEQVAPVIPDAAGTQLPTLADLDASKNTIPVAPPVSVGSPAHPMGVPSLETLRGLFPELEILDVLGAGGMGAVYKARQPRLNRLVALKIMVAAPGHEADFALRFEREAQVLARLNHPHIVIIYDFGDLGPERTGADPLFYFLMEHVDGTDLGQLIKSRELKPTQALAIVPQICEALQYAHDQGITHRDIKPANILIDKRGTVKIADFGLAKMITGPEEALMTGLTQTGTAMGTPHYMAPEQWEHPEQVDHRADIYALGGVFYEMLTGERPAGVFEPPSKKSKSPVDKKLDGVVMRAMDKNPERRYQQAGQIGDDVTRISGANKRRPATTDGAPKPKRGPLKPLLAVGATAALAAGGWGLWPEEAERKRTQRDVAPAPPQVAWVPMYRQAAEMTPLFSKPKALYPAFQSHAALVQEPAAGLKLADGWLTPTTTQVKLPLPSARNAGVRLKVKMSDPDKMDGASIWLRSVDGGVVYSGNWRGIIQYFGQSPKAAEYLAARKNLVAKKLGDSFTLEFYAIGTHLVCRYEGDALRVSEPAANRAPGTLNHLMIRNPVTDIGFINLDDLSEAEALKLAGVEEAKDLAVTSAFKPGRLRATGTMLSGRPPDLAKFAAHDDFADVAGGVDSWVALRANGETVSSDGKADFTGIRKIARSYHGYACFIDRTGGLRFHPAREMALPASLKGGKVADAACGNHHGVALLEDGRAVVFGRRYEEAVDDVSQAQGSGTPRWPQPEAAALENVKGVAVTQTHAATLHHDGTVSVWGWKGAVTWQPEPGMKPVRQISSFHDALHLLDEAGQVWSFSLPRSAHPQQPVGFTGRVRLLAKDAVRLRDHLWRNADGTWRAVEADRPTVEMLESVTLEPETNFVLMASVSGARPYGYALWIEPGAPGGAAGPPAAALPPPTALGGPSALPSAKPGRLRAAGTTANGKPHDLAKFAAYDDFVDVAGGWGRWVALRVNGRTVSSDGKADFSDIAKITASFNVEYAFITSAGKLVIPPYGEWTLPSSLERGVEDAALGMQHGIALLEGGRAEVFGARYEGVVGDPAQANGYGTPRWPMPEAVALEKVKAVAATVTHAATLHEDGTLSLWGWEGPLKWETDPRQKPLRELRSTEDGFWALDEAGQLWHLPVPRNPAPGQLVYSSRKPTLSNAGVTHLKPRCWRRQSGEWAAHINTKNGMALMKEAGLSENTAFSLSGGLFDGKPFASLLWIEPGE